MLLETRLRAFLVALALVGAAGAAPLSAQQPAAARTGRAPPALETGASPAGAELRPAPLLEADWVHPVGAFTRPRKTGAGGLPGRFTVGNGGRYLQLDLLHASLHAGGNGFSARLTARTVARPFADYGANGRFGVVDRSSPVTLLDTSFAYEGGALPHGWRGRVRLDVRNLAGRPYLMAIELDPLARLRGLQALTRSGRSFGLTGQIAF